MGEFRRSWLARRSVFVAPAAVALGFMACGGSDQSDGAAGGSSLGGSATGGSATGGSATGSSATGGQRPSTGGERATSGGAPVMPSDGGSSGQLATGGDAAAGAGGVPGGAGGSDAEGGAAATAGEGGSGGAPDEEGPRGFVLGYGNASRSYLQFEVLIVNDSDRTVSVDSLEVRYYLTDEGGRDGSVDYGMLIGDDGAVAELQSTYFVTHWPLDPPRDGANGYVALSSNYDGAPFQPGQWIRLHVHFDSLNQIPYNDYSYADTAGELIEAESMSLYVDGELVWGSPP